MSNKKTRIFFTYHGGNIGNQMITFSHLMTFYKSRNDVVVANMAFFPYLKFFNIKNPYLPENLRGRDLLTVLIRIFYFMPGRVQIFTIKAIHWLARRIKGFASIITGGSDWLESIVKSTELWTIDSFDNHKLNGEVSSNRIILLAGWEFRDWKRFEEKQNIIRNYLAFKNDLLDQVDDFFGEHNLRDFTTVGVTIRQSDYREWRDGKYFFPTTQYVAWMKEVRSLLGDRVKFLIVSEEQQDESLFTDLSYIFGPGKATGQGHYMLNMIALSKCKYLMTPPSTFSAWASFMGQNIVIPLYKETQRIKRSEFLQNHIFDLHQHPFMGESVM